MTAGGTWDPVDDGRRQFRFNLNGTAFEPQAQWKAISVQVGAGATISRSMNIPEGTWVSFEVYQSSGDALPVNDLFMQMDYLSANP